MGGPVKYTVKALSGGMKDSKEAWANTDLRTGL